MYVVKTGQAVDTNGFALAFDVFWKAWLTMMGLDLLNLFWKYLCCWLCCRCCIPKEDVFRDLLHWRADADVPNNVAQDAENATEQYAVDQHVQVRRRCCAVVLGLHWREAG